MYVDYRDTMEMGETWAVPSQMLISLAIVEQGETNPYFQAFLQNNPSEHAIFFISNNTISDGLNIDKFKLSQSKTKSTFSSVNNTFNVPE